MRDRGAPNNRTASIGRHGIRGRVCDALLQEQARRGRPAQKRGFSGAAL